jgi:hypothetical protein
MPLPGVAGALGHIYDPLSFFFMIGTLDYVAF